MESEILSRLLKVPDGPPQQHDRVISHSIGRLAARCAFSRFSYNGHMFENQLIYWQVGKQSLAKMQMVCVWLVSADVDVGAGISMGWWMVSMPMVPGVKQAVILCPCAPDHVSAG